MITNRSHDLLTRARPSGPWGRLAQFPLVRILIVVLFLVPEALFHNLTIVHIVEKMPHPWFTVLLDVVSILDVALVVFLYSRYTRWIEKRPAVEFGLRGAGREFGAGALISVLLVGMAWGAIVIGGSYRVLGVAHPWILLHAAIRFGTGAFLQVMIFRVILFRLTDELIGTYAALALAAMIFGLAHAINGNLTASGLAGLIVGDVLLVAAFALTRRVWFVWGMHAAWNFCQDGVLGMPNSGVTELPSWLEVEVEGPWWLTGGEFGIEASVTATALSILVGVGILQRARARGQVLRPVWKRVVELPDPLVE